VYKFGGEFTDANVYFAGRARLRFDRKRNPTLDVHFGIGVFHTAYSRLNGFGRPDLVESVVNLLAKNLDLLCSSTVSSSPEPRSTSPPREPCPAGVE